MYSKTYEELKKQAERYPPLSPEVQEALACLAAAGDKKAEELLILHNAKRFLYFAEVFAPEGPGLRQRTKDPRLRAMSHWRRFAPKSITIDDIISAAQYGFLKAIRSYRPDLSKKDVPGFNRYANILIWREIQALRVGEESEPGEPVPEEILENGTEENGGKEVPLPEREVALMLLSFYAEKHLAPEEAQKLLRMIRGEEPPDYGLLAELGAKLRHHVPPADWDFMAEALTSPRHGDADKAWM